MRYNQKINTYCRWIPTDGRHETRAESLVKSLNGVKYGDWRRRRRERLCKSLYSVIVSQLISDPPSLFLKSDSFPPSVVIPKGSAVGEKFLGHWSHKRYMHKIMLPRQACSRVVLPMYANRLELKAREKDRKVSAKTKTKDSGRWTKFPFYDTINEK